MGIFVGGFTIEAAERIMAALDGTKADVLEALSSLVDGSLISVQLEPSGRHRYAMLESMREFALERLAESDELDAVSRAHATYFIQLIEQDESRHHESDEHTWLHLQQDEVQNLYAVRQWLNGHPDVELELRLATAPGVYWILGGNLDAQRSRLEAVLEAMKATGPAEASIAAVKARITLGDTLTLLGDLNRAYDVLNESLARARELGDETSTAVCLISLGWCHALSGNWDVGTEKLEEGLAGAGATGDKLQVSRAQLLLGEVDRMRGLPDRSIARLQEALSGLRAVGELALTAVALTGLALGRAQKGDLAAAAGHLRESLEITEHMHNPWLVNALGERTALVCEEWVDNEPVTELLGALDGLKRRQGLLGVQIPDEQERLHSLNDALEGRLGYAAFYAAWQRGKGHSIDETTCLIGRVLNFLSIASLGSVSPPAGAVEEASLPARDDQAAETHHR
jgi:tetratricopeptide (TPR) repeat protein